MFRKSCCFTETEETGKTLIEILGVLVIVGVLTIIGLISYRHAVQKKLVNDLIYTIKMTNIVVLQDIENENFTNISDMNLFLEHYTQFVDKYKISFYAIESVFPEKQFGTNIELLDGSNMPPEICKSLALQMQNEYAIHALDVKADQKQTHIEAATVDVDMLCGK